MKALKPSIPAPARRCAIYTRKSTSAGLDQAFNSLDAQREACQRYLQSQSWTALPHRYDDGGFTGASLDRPAFRQLMADVESGLVDVVVVYKVDRLSRSLLDFARVMDTFNARNVAFVSVTQNFSTADAIGRLTLNMLMSFAEFEREMIAERTRDKISAARRKGKWTGGIVPMGYTPVDRRLHVCEDEAVIVRQLFQKYLEGNSAVRLSQWLNDQGIPLKHQQVPRERPWNKDLVLRILKNPLYRGMVHSQGRHYPGEQTALVEADMFDQVQAMLAPKVRVRHWGTRNPYYLVRGTLKCGQCGSVMTTASTHTKGRTYRYYRCVRRGKQGSATCATRQLPAEAIESFVVDQLREAIRQGRISIHQVNQRLRSLEQVKERLLLERGHGQASTSLEVSEEALRLDRELIKLDLQIREAEWLERTLEDFEGLWEVLTPVNRQRLVRTLVEEVIVDEARGEVVVRLVDLKHEMEVPDGIAG